MKKSSDCTMLELRDFSSQQDTRRQLPDDIFIIFDPMPGTKMEIPLFHKKLNLKVFNVYSTHLHSSQCVLFFNAKQWTQSVSSDELVMAYWARSMSTSPSSAGDRVYFWNSCVPIFSDLLLPIASPRRAFVLKNSGGSSHPER